MSDKSEKITRRLYEAIELAFKLHGKDARKKSPVPVLAHLLSVCAIVQHDGGSEDEAIAALLHDVLEDKPEQTSRKEITDSFGEVVLEYIEYATDTSPDYKGEDKEPWKVRKERYLVHVREADPAKLRVTIADKIDNIRAILADYHRLGEDFWTRFNCTKQESIWYYKSALAAYKEAGMTGPLVDELDRLVNLLPKE